MQDQILRYPHHVDKKPKMVRSYSALEQVLLDSESERASTNFDGEGDDIYIGDSGASSHLTNDKRWMYDIQPVQGSVIVANDHKMKLECKGLLDVTFVQRDCTKVNKTLRVRYSPDLQQNLFRSQ